jgi:Fe-S-cluster-containing hydrogenase component 2
MDKTQDRTYGRHVVQYPPDYSFCAGCTSCEVVCALEHEGCVSPSFSRLFVDRDNRSMVHTIYACQHCSDHPCYDACPKKDSAMRIDEDNIVWIDGENCIGCGLCAKACVFDPPRINVVKSKDKNKRKARKCDMCRTRPEGPACVQWCPVRCIGLSDGPAPVPAPKEEGN